MAKMNNTIKNQKQIIEIENRLKLATKLYLSNAIKNKSVINIYKEIKPIKQ